MLSEAIDPTGIPLPKGSNPFQVMRAPSLFGQENVNVIELLDEQATREGILQQIEAFADQAQPQDTVVLFLAGHGTMLGQRYYFVPHEFQHGAEKLEDDIRNQGLAGDELNDAIAKLPALKRVVIYETCQSGGVLPITRTARDAFAFRGALERMAKATGSFTIAATSASAEAHEVDQLGHCVLTYALLAGLGEVDGGPLQNQPIKSGEQTLEVRDWFTFAQEKVPLLTKLLLGEEQFAGYTGQGISFPILPFEIKNTP